MRYLRSSLCPALVVFVTVGCNSGVDVFSGGDGDVFSGGDAAVCDAEFVPTVVAFERVASHQNRITTAMKAIADHSTLNSEFLGIY